MALVKLPWALECQLKRDAGLSFIEYHALARLSEDPDHTLRMSVLAELTPASLSRLSHLIQRLESRGLVPSRGRPQRWTLHQCHPHKIRLRDARRKRAQNNGAEAARSHAAAGTDSAFGAASVPSRGLDEPFSRPAVLIEPASRLSPSIRGPIGRLGSRVQPPMQRTCSGTVVGGAHQADGDDVAAHERAADSRQP